MNWTQLLKEEAAMGFAATTGLVKLVEAKDLAWKPSTGKNWLTTGQLLHHLGSACGSGFQGFVTGEWKDDSVSPGDNPEQEGMLPPADRFNAVKSVDEALKRLDADKALTMEMIGRAGEKDLGEKKVSAPWGGPEMILGRYLLMMIDHQKTHKAQLFYYLKLQGKPVDTHHLYGM